MLEVSLAKRIGTLDLALVLSVGAETLLVAGPNGAGKSTLLLLLLGVARPDRGRIALDGRTLFDTHADVPAEDRRRSEEHTSELQSRLHLVCRLLLEKKKKKLERNAPIVKR